MQLRLFAKARPLTLADAMQRSPSFHAAVRCVLRAATARGHRDADKAISDAACADWLADLDWTAATLGVYRDAFDADWPTPKYAARTTPMRTLFRSTVAAALARGDRPQTPASIEIGERAARVMGRAGFSHRGAGGLPPGPGAYGYAIEGSQAWGVVPAERFDTYEPLPLQSTTITCDADRAQACTVRIPTTVGLATFVVKTNGTLQGSTVCIAIQGRDLSGWEVLGRMSSAQKLTRVALDQKGCARDSRRLIDALTISFQLGLVPPGQGGGEVTLNGTGVGTALSLAAFLAERVRQ